MSGIALLDDDKMGLESSAVPVGLGLIFLVITAIAVYFGLKSNFDNSAAPADSYNSGLFSFLPKSYSQIGIAMNQMPPYNSIPLEKSKQGDLSYRVGLHRLNRARPLLNGEVINLGSKLYRTHLYDAVNMPQWVAIGNLVNNTKTNLVLDLQQKGIHFRALSSDGKTYYVIPQDLDQIKNGGIVRLVDNNKNPYVPFNGSNMWNVSLGQAYSINNLTTV